MSSKGTMANFSALLADPRVRTKDPEKVKNAVTKLVNGGPEKLQFIVDFDYTITRAHRNGQNVDCSWGVMENYKDCPKTYLDTTKALKKKFLPIEIDPDLSIEQKTPSMIEWYKEANNALMISGIQKDWFERMVKASNCELRDDTDKLFDNLKNHEVPILVLSAGCGDLVDAIMEHYKINNDNVKTVSNFIEFDNSGKIVGLFPPMIHMFNKSENAIHDSDYFKELKKRTNVVLMGDSLGDLRMAEGVENPDVVLKIGFLNSKVKERLDQYMEGFDVVLVDDQTMDFPNAILSDILANNNN
jgi:HAD superfamily hydrolase (TIGR01544 family)